MVLDTCTCRWPTPLKFSAQKARNIVINFGKGNTHLGCINHEQANHREVIGSSRYDGIQHGILLQEKITHTSTFFTVNCTSQSNGCQHLLPLHNVFVVYIIGCSFEDRVDIILTWRSVSSSCALERTIYVHFDKPGLS